MGEFRGEGDGGGLGAEVDLGKFGGIPVGGEEVFDTIDLVEGGGSQVNGMGGIAREGDGELTVHGAAGDGAL